MEDATTTTATTTTNDEKLISYSGLTEAEVIYALYKSTRAIGLGALADRPGFTLEEAQRYVDHATEHAFGPPGQIRFDYVSGRPLKVMLDTKAKQMHRVDLYDRDAGQGEGALAISRALAAKLLG